MGNKLTIVKVGGKIVEEEESLDQLLKDFAKIKGYKLLVHGGGRSASKLAEKLGIESHMVNGRRITDKETLKIVTMVYGGLVNKTIVAKLQAMNISALGLTGADLNIIQSEKRPVIDIDYGYVGDVKKVNSEVLYPFIKSGVSLVLAPLTHDNQGNILNTNADTIAGEIAKGLSKDFDVTLIFCFEKKGVLLDEKDENTVLPSLSREEFTRLVNENVIQGGMIPKLENSFAAIDAGVKEIIITKASEIGKNTGTKIS